jgi:hypothetical protein
VAIPEPEPGLVIRYSYLWHHQAGRAEGGKDRPAAILVAVKRAEGASALVRVLPITHSQPVDPDSAIEIPAAVKMHLGLDSSRSWIAVHEGNDFLWPGHDLRPIPGTKRFDYGFLPPKFFDQVKRRFAAWHKKHRSKSTARR